MVQFLPGQKEQWLTKRKSIQKTGESPTKCTKISPSFNILLFFFLPRNVSCSLHPTLPFSSSLFIELIMLAASRKAIISTASKATYATSATASQITTAANGVKVASSQEPGQTASLAVVVNGGARAESGSNAGVAHFLKNYGFKVYIYICLLALVSIVRRSCFAVRFA